MRPRLYFSRFFAEPFSIFGKSNLLRWKGFYLLPLILLLSCNTDDIPDTEVPSMVLNAFHLKFPEAKEVQWELATAGYEVNFEISEEEGKVLLDREGSILKLRKNISYSDLPRAVRNRIKESYSSANEEEASLLEIGNRRYYKVELERFVINDKITFNENGEVISGISF